jgi:hypothetical protein
MRCRALASLAVAHAAVVLGQSTVDWGTLTASQISVLPASAFAQASSQDLNKIFYTACAGIRNDQVRQWGVRSR